MAMISTAAQTYAVESHNPEHLHAIVDIGSNGVRFSITTLHPLTARILPTLYTDRAAISLYDAQFQYSTLSSSHIKSPIPASTISEITTTLLRFRSICKSYSVPAANIKLIATEATRTAPNSAEFRASIESALGWTVTLLPKDEEGAIGALGIASSFATVEGLVMDLGGGSTQLSWMVSRHGTLTTAKQAVSLPFGAAALTKKLQTALNSVAVAATASHIREELTKAVDTLDLPEELKHDAEKEGGYTLYLSGGGFRGFGYLLLAEHDIQPYPIPIINGFSATREKFTTLAEKIGVELSGAQQEELGAKFRISDRRAGQVPAVAFLIRNLLRCLPQIKSVVFCQGGVREGYLYNMLSEEVRGANPLVVATEVYRIAGSGKVSRVINDALPKSTPDVFWREIVPALANLMYFHKGVMKEGRASAGLHFTTTGLLGGVHGLTHVERALLGLVLCARWGGEVAESGFKERLEKVVGVEMSWWARYVGAVAHAVGAVFPVGIADDGNGDVEGIKRRDSGGVSSGSDDGSGNGRRRRLSEVDGKISFFARDVARKEHSDIVLRVRVVNDDPDTSAIMVKKAVEDIEKVGKKKNCDGFRRKVSVIWETVE
ncbi:hypothetical protein H072_8430 [Dactylellina haptotyla CBS 200.50]|uniref:Uncharacterized protein n=1 Tax=Dactylellina haptotyla (strain CBS 200.50) TaxID=1284197 RepID=S8AA18_DACHA|nr:hypothetical protein H072_8430 [Dactylellina haptotyla CBS 200.50]